MRTRGGGRLHDRGWGERGDDAQGLERVPASRGQACREVGIDLVQSAHQSIELMGEQGVVLVRVPPNHRAP